MYQAELRKTYHDSSRQVAPFCLWKLDRIFVSIYREDDDALIEPQLHFIAKPYRAAILILHEGDSFTLCIARVWSMAR